MRIGITERGDGGLDQSWRVKLHKKEVDGAIVITKAPHLIESIPDNVVLHCTITGFGGFWPEPNVINPGTAIEAYYKLINKYGGERVVLRIDPIIPYWGWESVAIAIKEKFARGRVRISFLDLYNHVKQKLKDNWAIKDSSPDMWDFMHKDAPLHAPLTKRFSIWESMGKPEVCGEPNMECTGCVSERDVIAMGLNPLNLSGGKGKQRSACKCIAEKTELLTNKKRCLHGCLYCYWQD